MCSVEILLAAKNIFFFSVGNSGNFGHLAAAAAVKGIGIALIFLLTEVEGYSRRGAEEQRIMKFLGQRRINKLFTQQKKIPLNH